jgi:transcription initiation factor IIE alpha subunit
MKELLKPYTSCYLQAATKCKTHAELMIYIVLASNRGRRGTINLNDTMLARLAGVDRRSVHDAIQGLKEAGVIDYKDKGSLRQGKVYTLTDEKLARADKEFYETIWTTKDEPRPRTKKEVAAREERVREKDKANA